MDYVSVGYPRDSSVALEAWCFGIVNTLHTAVGDDSNIIIRPFVPGKFSLFPSFQFSFPSIKSVKEGVSSVASKFKGTYSTKYHKV